MSELIARTATKFTEIRPTPEQQATLATVQAELQAEGENVPDEWMRTQFNDTRLLDTLSQAEQQTGVPLKEYVRHSSRFFGVDRSTITDGVVQIPQGPNNVKAAGALRRAESGRQINLAKVAAQGVDASKVLYYRATQPSSTPKPEYYWTSDANEPRGGLNLEIGDQAETAVILVSTLEDIANNGGLIEDMNDDNGIAVRQIGLDSFDQSQALGSFQRSERVKGRPEHGPHMHAAAAIGNVAIVGTNTAG